MLSHIRNEMGQYGAYFPRIIGTTLRISVIGAI